MEFELQCTLQATPQEVYDAWMDSDKHSDMTGGQALITDDEGDKFSAWDGYIWGGNLELVSGKYIKQSWRTSEFQDDQPHSLVEIFLEAKEDGCLLRLKHSNLTDADEQYKQGWVDNYFEPMQQYFS